MAYTGKISRNEAFLRTKHLFYLKFDCFVSTSPNSLLVNKYEELTEFFVLSVFVNDFQTKYIIQLATEAHENKSNWLKSCQEN